MAGQKRPTFYGTTSHDTNHIAYTDTLDEQIKLYNQHHILARLTDDIESKLQTKQADYELAKSCIDNSLLKALYRGTVDSLPYVIDRARILYFLYAILFDGPYSMHLSVSDKSILTKFIHRWQHKLEKWLCLIAATVYYAPASAKSVHAMGYDGVDKPTIARFKGQLNVVDTTPWVWSHSDMKIPSKDIMEKVYKKQIIDYKGMNFRFHVGKG